jgi:uncharacterized paraquat-inducible protein A
MPRPRVKSTNMTVIPPGGERNLTVHGASDVVLIETADVAAIDVSYYGTLNGSEGFIKIGDLSEAVIGTVISIDGNGCWEQIKVANNSDTVDAPISISARWG